VPDRVGTWWGRLLDGFWFVPGATALAYAALAVVAVRIDRSAGSDDFDFTFQGDADAARDILTTIAGSLITVAGLAFSLTIVVLTLVSSQFSPRAVRSMLADKVNQVVAGSFVGIFAYCLLVLRSVRTEDGERPEFVPALGVTLGIALALVALALLLTFIHHAGTSIQVSRISARIAAGTLTTLDRLYPEPHGEPLEAESEHLVEAWRRASEPGVVHAARVGFVQGVALDDVFEIVDEPGARIHVAVRPGDFVTDQTALVELWPASALSEDRVERIRRAFLVGEARDARQDAAYGIRQLADIALRALSPGVNDPTTAENCIAYLAAALERLAGRTIPSPVRRHPQHEAILIARRRSFGEYVEEAFGEIGRYAADNARVVVDAVDALARVAAAAHRAGAPERVAIVRELATAAAAQGIARAVTERDRSAIRSALAELEPAAGAPGTV
jgi:uncharacterized membrane protein